MRSVYGSRSQFWSIGGLVVCWDPLEVLLCRVLGARFVYPAHHQGDLPGEGPPAPIGHQADLRIGPLRPIGRCIHFGFGVRFAHP